MKEVRERERESALVEMWAGLLALPFGLTS